MAKKVILIVFLIITQRQARSERLARTTNTQLLIFHKVCLHLYNQNCIY
jgi:hypothetical protein